VGNVLSAGSWRRIEGKIIAVEGEAGSEVAVLELENGASSVASRWLTSRRRGWRFTCNRTQSEGISDGQFCRDSRRVSRGVEHQAARSRGTVRTADGRYLAALAKKYGPNVQAEVNIDDGKGDIRIVLLKTVVPVVEDSSNQISIDDAKTFDESFEAGDVMESRSTLPSSVARPSRRPSSDHSARPRGRADAHS
jgi:hypothetical protein